MNEPSSETANGDEPMSVVFFPICNAWTEYVLYEWMDRKNTNHRWCVKNMRLIFGIRVNLVTHFGIIYDLI